MNKVISSVFVLLFAVLPLNDLLSQDVFTEYDPHAKAWQVFGSASTHPDDPLLLEVGDIFVLKKPSPNSAVVHMKPVKVKNPELQNIDKQSQGNNVFSRGKKERPNSSEQVAYLCNNSVSLGGVEHLIVISPQVDHPDQITIQWKHNEGSSKVKCKDIVLPSHGGLAHAHAVR